MEPSGCRCLALPTPHPQSATGLDSEKFRSSQGCRSSIELIFKERTFCNMHAPRLVSCGAPPFSGLHRLQPPIPPTPAVGTDTACLQQTSSHQAQTLSTVCSLGTSLPVSSLRFISEVLMVCRAASVHGGVDDPVLDSDAHRPEREAYLI